MSGLNPGWLIGKTIESVDMRPFDAGGPGTCRSGTAHDPLIVFTDGSRIRFLTEETESGEYGVDIVYSPSRHEQQAASSAEVCVDCGAKGQTTGHIECQLPGDHAADLLDLQRMRDS